MDTTDVHVIGLLIVAASAQVERGHFQELYEGFNNCTALRYGKNPERTGVPYNTTWVDIDKCNCGIREALDALDAAIERDWFRPDDGWDRDVR